jgi:hypothetical protein
MSLSICSGALLQCVPNLFNAGFRNNSIQNNEERVWCQPALLI